MSTSLKKGSFHRRPRVSCPLHWECNPNNPRREAFQIGAKIRTCFLSRGKLFSLSHSSSLRLLTLGPLPRGCKLQKASDGLSFLSNPEAGFPRPQPQASCSSLPRPPLSRERRGHPAIYIRKCLSPSPRPSPWNPSYTRVDCSAYGSVYSVIYRCDRAENTQVNSQSLVKQPCQPRWPTSGHFLKGSQDNRQPERMVLVVGEGWGMQGK